MKALFALCFVAFIAGSSAQCACKNMKWATCDGTPCTCTLLVDSGFKQPLNCDQLVPKCFLMKAEMYRARNGLSTRSFGGKPVDTAIVDNDGIYDPECDNFGHFKAIQCNKTETCWCVNSAGVRRSDKGDKNLKCEPVETNWIRLELTHNDTSAVLDPAKLKTGFDDAFLARYGLAKGFVQMVQYDKASRRILVDLKKSGNVTDLATMAYYLEKDVKVLPLFKEQTQMAITVDGNKVNMQNILVYYVDEKPPTMTMQKLTGGVIAVIVVVLLAVVIGLIVMVFLNKRDKALYSKAQAREMDTMS